MADTTELAYREVFGCALDDGEDHDHEGDCRWHWFCGICSRPVDDTACPVHAPTQIPGLVAAECDAEHPRTFFYAQEGGYPPPCMYCSYAALSAAHNGCEHSHHRAWRRWKPVRWLAHKAAMAGIGHATGYRTGGGCSSCMTGFKWGPAGYVLGKRREWWFCLLRRRHLFKPVPCIHWMCDTCFPDPDPQTPALVTPRQRRLNRPG